MKLIDRLNQFTSIQYTEFDLNKNLESSSVTKFILSEKKLKKVLDEIKEHYYILKIKEQCILKYTNEYYDTEDLQLYMSYHNGNGERYLIKNNEIEGIKNRSFEIKYQSNKGEISKLKHKSKSSENENGKIEQLIVQNTPYKPEMLKKIFKNQFYRIILIHKSMNEKITIDLDFSLSNLSNKIKLPYLAIVELKQAKFSLSSEFVTSIRRQNVQKISLNKYCIGVALLNKDVKKNKFKSKLLAINKINESSSYTEPPFKA